MWTKVSICSVCSTLIDNIHSIRSESLLMNTNARANMLFIRWFVWYETALFKQSRHRSFHWWRCCGCWCCFCCCCWCTAFAIFVLHFEYYKYLHYYAQHEHEPNNQMRKRRICDGHRNGITGANEMKTTIAMRIRRPSKQHCTIHQHQHFTKWTKPLRCAKGTQM